MKRKKRRISDKERLDWLFDTLFDDMPQYFLPTKLVDLNNRRNIDAAIRDCRASRKEISR